MAQSIVSRKCDLVYFVFFLTHIPIMFTVDLYPLWPTAVRPAFMDDVRGWYVATYQDRNFVSPAPWFTAYMALEAVYHVPLSFWAVGALLRDDPLVPLHLLVFALEVAITTFTCIVEYLSWDDFSSAQKFALGQLYVPYLALALFMGGDMFLRLQAMTSRLEAHEKTKKAA